MPIVDTSIPIVGQPVTWATGFLVLVLMVFTGEWVKSIVTIAHEGGHVIMGILTFRKPGTFVVEANGDAATKVDGSFGAGDWFVTLAGYMTPPLLGFGGAVALAQGKAWSVLWAAIILTVAAYFQAGNPLANALTFVTLAGLVAAALFGSLLVQTMVAVGIVWLMLLGGASQSIWLSRADQSDAYWMARHTLIPRIVWHGVWATVGVSCLVFGAKRMLGF